jgi:hypothetical protein
MHWPNGEQIVRVDGKDRQSILVFRESCGIERDHFAHDYLSELLRSAIVASVSAIDRLLHDLVVKHSWKLLTQREDQVPKKLKELPLTAYDAKKALEHLRRDGDSRPGNIIKRALQDRLHRDFTFQTPDSILGAAKLLGISDFWGKVADSFEGSPTKGELVEMLRKITKRRNQIVHEADLIRTSRREASLREISHPDAEEWVTWMDKFGRAVAEVVEANV